MVRNRLDVEKDQITNDIGKTIFKTGIRHDLFASIFLFSCCQIDFCNSYLSSFYFYDFVFSRKIFSRKISGKPVFQNAILQTGFQNYMFAFTFLFLWFYFHYLKFCFPGIAIQRYVEQFKCFDILFDHPNPKWDGYDEVTLDGSGIQSMVEYSWKSKSSFGTRHRGMSQNLENKEK